METNSSLCKLCLSLLILVVTVYTAEGALTKVCPGKPADIAFVIDESSSIWPVHFRRLRQFISNLTASFDIGLDQTRVAAITYSDKVTHRFSLSDYKNEADVRKAISRIDQRRGGTRTDMALKHVRHQVFSDGRDGVPKIVVLITDGASWYPKLTSHQAQLLRRENVTIFVVAISNNINWDEIESIATQPSEGHIFTVDSFSDLGGALVDRLVTSTCKVQGNPVGVCTINLQSDVVFVLGSASQNPAGTMPALSMVQQIISDKNTFVGDASLRFGLLPKQCDLDFGFNLNSFDNKEQILNHFEQKQVILSAADHLDHLVSESFTEINGDRPQVRNLAVVIMDRASPNFEETVEAAGRAKEAGIEIVAVAVGKEVDDYEVSLIASQPTDNYKITLSDYSEIKDLKHKFYSIICP